METLKPYQQKLINNVLFKLGIESTDYNILNNINDIYNFINKSYATTTKRDYLIILSLVMKGMNQQKTAEVIYSKAKEYAKEHNDNEFKQTLDNNERLNYLTYNELINKVEELRMIYNNKPNYKNIVKLLVLGLYTLHPPLRNDYYNMRIINNDYEDDKKHNFILIDDRQNIYIIINKDKVINIHGRAEILINNPTLRSILLTYINEYAPDNVYLFQRKNGQPYTKAQIKYIINNMFNHKLLNIYNLRSAYISEYYKHYQTLIKRKELADKMRHTHKMAEMSYLKFI